MSIHKGENPYIYGLHDRGGEHLMIVNGEARGWVVVTEEIGDDPNNRRGGDYQTIAGRGLGLIVRLNNAYGESGTIPREARYPQFSQRAANFVAASRGAHIWLIGNEMNLAREQPRRQGTNEPEPITPRRYAECYKLCRQRIKEMRGHEDDLVVVGAVGPWNVETKYEEDPRGKYPANPTGDWILYMRDVLLAIGPDNCDAIAIHAYSHGYAPELVFSTAKMDPPFANRHYNFFTYRDQMEAIPKNMRHLPVYLTEANGDREKRGEPTWPFGNNGWIKNAYQEINNWNRSGKQQIRCMALFRWQKDPLGWSIDGKPEVQKDFQEAIAKGYKWRQEVSKPEPKPEPKEEESSAATPGEKPVPGPVPRPARPGYRTRYINHNTPTTVSANQTLNVGLTIQNTGSFTWVRGGSNPFRLGFQWYDSNGQMVQLPSELDFRTPLPRDVPPDGTVTLQARLRTPGAPGPYQLRWDMVHEMVTWFVTQGDAGLLVSPITVQPAQVVKPAPPAKPTETPSPAPVQVQIRDVSSQLAQHPSTRYATRPLNAIRRIIIHHTATPPSVTIERIAQFQVQNGLPGITYHICITANGQAYQTQPFIRMAAHAGQDSRDSVGVCLIGNFMENPPPQAQLEAAASALAQLAAALNLTTDQIFGYSEIAKTHSPGATWPGWKRPLLVRVQDLMSVAKPKPQPAEEKPIDHYMLFWHRGAGNWAEWDLRGALDYISKFPVTMGFSVEEARLAKNVTIVGGPGGVPESVDQMLRASGSKVDRIAGESETDTRRILEELARQGKRFRDLR